MSDIIQLLPDHVANQIAAGEVIQRPASVLKELLENSKDAGSDSIKIFIKDAGKWLIQIQDNGCGMSTIDSRMAFEKHATSKIKTVEDIFTIKTMGFRGEALPSIAAIAQVELKTKQADSEMGNLIVIEGSEIVLQEPTVCPKGTSISVKNLFYNIPARRNFLKSNSVELKHIYDEILRFALSNPQIAIQAHNDNKLWLEFPVSNLKTRIARAFGNNYPEKIVDCNEENPLVDIKGFVGKPEFAKKTRGEQYFFVNNRYIRDNYLHHAVMKAYEGLIPTDAFPFYVLHLSINPSEIDVNVHPGKTEIKFENDKNIYQIMKAAVKRSIGLFNLSPSIDFESDPNEFLFQKSTEIPQAPGSAIDYEYNPFKPTKQHNLNLSPKRDWQQFFENFEQKQHKTERIDRTELATELFEKEKIQPKSTTIFQLNQRFIVAPIAKGLLLVDQKAAHEKILFHQLVQHTHPIEKQLLLYPISFECPNPIVDFLTDLLPLLNDMGIEIKHFGQNTFVIEAHPMLFSEEGIEQLIAEMIQDKSFQQESDILLIRKHIASKLAIHKAIPHGKILSTEEMEDLVSKLFMCTEPEYGIRKNKTMVVLSAEEIITLINK